MTAHKLQSFVHFAVEELSFTEFPVQMHLFVLRYAVYLVRALIENLVITRPKFEGKVGSQWNESMELSVVSRGPRQAGQNHNSDRS